MRVRFHGLQTPGPVASESASARAASRSSTSALPSRVSTTRLTVAGSSRSRRVAVCGSSRWWRTIAPSRATSGSGKPSRRPICTARASPTTEWSPPRPFPMSCRRVPTSSRSGRPTRVVSRATWAQDSTRCRSTVQTCARSRGGRSRTAPHSGNNRPHRPVRSSDSTTSTSGWPVPSSDSSSSRAARGHGSRSSGAVSASRCRVPAAIGSPVRAAVAATRSTRPGSRLAARVPGQGDLSPRARRRRRRAGAAPVPGAGPRARDVGNAPRARPQPHLDRERRPRGPPRTGPWRARTGRRAPAPTRPRRASCARRTSRARPASRCSSVRTSSSSVRAASTSPAGRSTSWAAASASTSWTSRRPPWPFFRSGSTRWATSPLRPAVVGAVGELVEPAADAGPPRLADRACDLLRQLGVTRDVPASSSPNAARRSVAATCTAWPGVRTEWSSPMPASQSGYQSPSASRSTSRLPSCSRTRSRSE